MISIKFEWRDLWFGVYVKEPWWEGGFKFHRLYVCIIPTLPIVIEWSKRGDW